MKIQNIQALRALAALMVLLLHSAIVIPEPDVKASLWHIPGFTDHGGLGVNLFFAISGFIIATVLSRQPFSLSEYVKRRFWRIYPLLWIAILLGLYHHFVNSYWFQWEFDQMTRVDPWGLLKSATLVPQAGMPFWQPAWTLEHEVLFYIIAAIAAPLIGLRGLAVLLWLLGTTGLFFKLPWEYHLASHYQVYFAAGVGAYVLRSQPLVRAVPVALAGLSLAYLQLYGVIRIAPWAFDYALAVGCAAIIVTAVQAEQTGWVAPRPLVMLGDASYSLYLLHWMLIPIAANLRVAAGWGTAEAWRWAFVGTSVCVALVSHRMFERPIIEYSHRRKPRTSLAHSDVVAEG